VLPTEDSQGILAFDTQQPVFTRRVSDGKVSDGSFWIVVRRPVATSPKKPLFGRLYSAPSDGADCAISSFDC